MTVAIASRSSMYQFRIDAQEKIETFAILNNMGIKPSQAVRLFFRQIRQTKTIPFPIEEHIPNEALSRRLLAPASEKGYQDFNTLEGLFADLKK
jgi:addiction module RelB/DinJ family antitoxin